MKKIQLRKICHSREGDKGDIANVSLICYNKKHYELIRNEVTAERVREYFKGLVKGKVTRYEFPKLGALNFVMENALDGGQSRSLRIDAFGKSLSGYFLSLEIKLLDTEGN